MCPGGCFREVLGALFRGTQPSGMGGVGVPWGEGSLLAWGVGRCAVERSAGLAFAEVLGVFVRLRESAGQGDTRPGYATGMGWMRDRSRLVWRCPVGVGTCVPEGWVWVSGVRSCGVRGVRVPQGRARVAEARATHPAGRPRRRRGDWSGSENSAPLGTASNAGDGAGNRSRRRSWLEPSSTRTTSGSLDARSSLVRPPWGCRRGCLLLRGWLPTTG